MPAVLTTAGSVPCGHATGSVALSSGSPLRVDGAAVLVEADVVGAAVDQCVPSSSGQKACSKVAQITAGRATKLTIGGRPVLLATLAGTTDGVPRALLPASAAQSRLESA